MNALTIFIIRHAEKPGGDWPGPGLTDNGVADKESLVIRGWQRAGAWTALFGAGLGGSEYQTPQAIYATDPDDPKKSDLGRKHDEPSQRPYETVLPVAQRLGLEPPAFNTSFAKGQEAALVAALQNLSGVVLVAWEHKTIISDILPKLPVSNEGDLPTHWSAKRFDVVLRFVRAAGATDFVFTELHPCLMSGDSNKPLKSDPKDD
jgi:hypothetical protein